MTVLPLLLQLAGSLGQIIAELMIAYLIESTLGARVKKQHVTYAIAKAIEGALIDTVQTYPGFEVALNDSDFFKQPRVIVELQKMVSPTATPNLEVLAEEWRDHFGIPAQGDVKLVLSQFLKTADQNLRHIEEINDILHRKETTHSLASIESGITRIDDRLGGFETRFAKLLSEPTATPTNEIDKQYVAQIDVCQALIESGQPRAAKQQLLKLYEKLQSEMVSNQVRFRLLTNLAKCALELGDNSEGTQYIRQAYDIDPDNPKAQANLAFTYLIEGGAQDALDLANRVLAQTPTGTSARAVRVQAHAWLRDYRDLEDLVEPEHLSDAQYVGALGFVFARAKQYDQAISHLRRAIALNEHDLESRLFLAEVLVAKSSPSDKESIFQLVPRSRRRNEAIEQALKLVNEALQIARAGDNISRVHDAQAARAGLQGMLGELAGAKAGCDAVLNDNPRHIPALRNRIVIAAEEGNYQEVISHFVKLPEVERLDDAIIFIGAGALIETDKANEALELLEERCQEDAITDDRCVALKADALVKLGRIGDATVLRNALLVQRPGDPNALELAAYIDSIVGNSEGELQNLAAASNVATGQHRHLIRLRLALRYFDYRQFENAIQWFEQVDEEFLTESAHVRAYVTSLYSARQFGKAYAISRKARQAGLADPTLIEIEAWIAEYLGNLKEAAELDGILMERQPHEAKHAINRARIEYRSGNKDEAAATLERIDLSTLEGPIELMQVAEMLAFLGQPEKALSFAYRARRSGYANPDIHLYYVSLFLRFDEKVGNLDPKQVMTNTAVLVRSDGAPRWIKILDSVQPDNSRGEFSLDSDQAQRLLGCRVGDTVPFREGPIETLSYTIHEIQSIYVRAFQETLEEFSTLFPNHPGLHRIRIVDKDFTKFFTVVAGQSEFAQRLYEFYHEGAITLEQLAMLMGRPQLDIQQGLAGLEGHRIFASTGTEQDQAAERQRVETAVNITLGLSSLITLGLLDMLRAVRNRFDNVFVPQHVVDELDRSLVDREALAEKGSRTIGYENGRFLLEEVPPERVRKGIEDMRKLRSFIHDEFTIQGIAPEYAELLGGRDEQFHKVGPVSLATILVARQTASPLCVDDLRLRQYAKTTHGVIGFWSGVVIEDLLNRGLIDEGDHHRALTELIRAHYYFTPVSSRLLLWALEKQTYLVNRQAEKLFAMLKGPDTNEDLAVLIASQVLKQLWMRLVPDPQRVSILHMILRALVHDRIPALVLMKLDSVLGREFIVMPGQLHQIQGEILRWQKLNRPRSPVRPF